ncbi:hypothetical protein HK102_009562, partial [Quaeritorhiza haematococci]
VGLPLIPIALVCSRFTIADSLLPLLPLIVFGNQRIRLGIGSAGAAQSGAGLQGPPSPALAVVILPWARMAYNNFWSGVILKRE